MAARSSALGTMDFNPRSPHGERHRGLCQRWTALRFQPTLPARGATALAPVSSSSGCISTHAPRTGSDASRLFCSTLRCNISTHAPRTGSDAITRSASFSCIPFQPTLPARGATNFSSSVMYLPRFQPTLPARGATAGRKGGTRRGAHFNPRSPHGERQWLSRRADHLASISTHAPRTGSDGCQLAGAACQRIISTHAPRTGSDTNCK